MVTREPIGVVACIIPFNFPCDLYDQKVAPALMMGNAAIVLPSSDNPLTLMKLTEMLVEAGVPNGVIQCLTAPGSVKSTAVTDPRVHLVTLTGSTKVGIDTAKLAAANLTHTALELGGNDAFIVLEDGDVDLAVEEMIWGRMYNTGQVCCASKRFLVHNSLKDEFAQKAVERIKQLKVGMPSDESSQVGCLISEKAAIKVEKEVEKTVEQGGKIVLDVYKRQIQYKYGVTRLGQLGQLQKKMPITVAVMVLCSLSMVGIPPLAGFFSKWDLAIGAATAGEYIYIAVLIVSSLLNAIYFFRLFEHIFMDPEPVREEINPELKRELPWRMMIPISLCGVGVIVLGVCNVWFVNVLSSVIMGVTQ